MTREQLIAIARRYDTTMAYAMLKALGASHKPRRNRRRRRRGPTRREVRECMRQTYGALDRMP